jgi:uncharacterized Zn finger protein
VARGSATGPLRILLSADPESFLYGAAHLNAGRLRDLDVQDAVIAVEVDDDRPRTVRLGDGGATCPCPQGMARGAACEHQVAVALRQVHRQTGIEVNDLVAAWFEGTLAGVVPPDAGPGDPR